MANGDLKIQMRGQQGGENIYTNIQYMTEDVVLLSETDGILDDWYTTVWPLFQAQLSQAYTLISVEATLYIPTASLPRVRVITPGEAGDVVGDVLPPNVTVRLSKVPNNETKIPPTAEDFEVGRLVFSGIPEAQQVNGMLTTAAVTDWTSVAQNAQQFEALSTGSSAIFVMAMTRIVPGVGNEHVYVEDLYVRQFLGTQNTRKRR